LGTVLVCLIKPGVREVKYNESFSSEQKIANQQQVMASREDAIHDVLM
jgi:hypothetical protein